MEDPGTALLCVCRTGVLLAPGDPAGSEDASLVPVAAKYKLCLY